MALAGWASDIAALRSILPGWVSLKPNAALAIVLMGFALLSISLPPSNRSPRRLSTLRCRLARLCGLLAGLAGLVTLGKFALSWKPGVDMWWFRETASAVGTSHPDRMGPDTALCFVLLAVALEIARGGRKTRTTLLAPAVLGWLVGTIALVVLVFTFTLAGGASGWWGLTMMSVPAGVAFILLGAGVVLVAWRESASDPALPGNPAKGSDSHTGFAFLTVFLLLAAGLIATGDLSFRNYTLQFRAQVEQQLSAIADLKVNGLVRWREERLGDANTLYKNPAFSILVRRFFEKPNDPDARRLLLTWMTRVQANLDYERVILADPRGVISLSAPAVPPAAVPHLARDAAAGLGSGQVAFLDLHRDTPDGPIRMAVMVPIFDEPDGRRPLGLIVLQIDPARYLYPFIKRWPTPSPTAETLLVRREGNEAVFLNELRFQANAALVLRAPLGRVAQPAVQAALGREGVIEGLDYRGVPVVAALRTIPDSPWALVARIDAAEEQRPMRARLWQTIVLVGALLLGAAACVGMVWRQQRVRFYREKAAAADTIRESEERLNFALQAIHTGAWELDLLDHTSHRTLTHDRVFGYETLLPRWTYEMFLDHVLPEDRPAVDRSFREATAAQSDWNFECRIRRTDGEVRWIWAVGAHERDSAGKPTRMYGVVQDITGRKRAEEALRESEGRLRRAILYAPFPLMVHAEDGEVLMMSSTWTEISGYSHAEIPTVGDWTERANGTRQHVVREAVDRLYGLTEKIGEGEYEIRTKLGERRTWDFISAPLGALPDGRRLVMSMAVDVTERKRHEEELKRRNDELTRFTYTVSHDLKSPLVTIRTFLGYLEVDARNQDEDRIATDLAYIRGAADKMAQLLDELLDLSRVGRKMNPLVDAPLGCIVQEALDLVAGQIAGRGVTIRATAEPILLHGDRQRLVEVFQNLVDNAVKFMGDQPAPSVEIGVEQRHGEFVIFVRDNGIGIDPRHRHKLFGLFEKLDPHTEGTGIGLALVQRIVEAHGGKIWVESAGPGEGATFRFTLANTRRQSI
jgi:PAS domain S-box-containing protein